MFDNALSKDLGRSRVPHLTRTEDTTDCRLEGERLPVVDGGVTRPRDEDFMRLMAFFSCWHS